MVSMKDIATKCNVSVATVSKALNDRNDVGEETREYIKKTAKEMGYSPNSLARALRTNRSYNIGVLFVDELNARLHPLLARVFIITFLNPEINTKHAQLIFTSHDPWQLNSGILRRDEIWFTEKDSKGISTLYSLADFYDDNGSKIRKDENYEKNYLLGKYGAIPTLKYLEVFKED